MLCIDHPVIGIPLVILLIIVAIVKNVGKGKEWSTGHGAQNYVPPPAYAPPAAPRPSFSLEKLREIDAGFSVVLFEDFLYSLYAEVHQARGAGQLHRLSAYFTPQAAGSFPQPVGPVVGVVVGAFRVKGGEITPSHATVTVEFESNYTEGSRGFYVVETWRLTRKVGVASRTPARVKMFGCPSCGAPQEALFGGTCRHCNQAVNDGSFDWSVVSVQASRESRQPALTGNVEEQGTNLPTVRDPNAEARMNALLQKDPSQSWEQIKTRTNLIFQQFQMAWSARDLAKMRPFMSDTLFNTQAYWVQAYLAQHLRNITENAAISNIELAKVTSDAYFDAITLRVHASSLDYTVDDAGKVVSGSRTKPRAYTEYWTLIRGTQRKGPTRTELSCPNCGAPLDVSMAGDCKYCKVKITTGDFDWVLSRIEQDESYGA